MFRMSMVQNPASNEVNIIMYRLILQLSIEYQCVVSLVQEYLCVLEIPSFTKFWNSSTNIQMGFNQVRFFKVSLEAAQFKRISSKHTDKYWIAHEAFRGMSPCSLEMFFHPSTLARILDSNISHLEKRQYANAINFAIDARQTKSPRNSNDAPGASTATCQPWFDLNELPLTPPEDA